MYVYNSYNIHCIVYGAPAQKLTKTSFQNAYGSRLSAMRGYATTHPNIPRASKRPPIHAFPPANIPRPCAAPGRTVGRV